MSVLINVVVFYFPYNTLLTTKTCSTFDSYVFQSYIIVNNNIIIKEQTMASLSISLKPTLLVRLEEISTKMGFSKSKMAESAITQYLDDLEEDQKDVEVAKSISNEIKAGRMKTFSAAEVYKELGI